MQQNTSWKPILEDECLDHTWEAIDAIACGLRDSLGGLPAQAPAAECGCIDLAGGSAGISLFFTYLSLATRDITHLDTAATFLDRAMRTAEDLSAEPTFFEGFSGIAWVAEHVRQVLAPGGDDPVSEVDEVIEKLIADSNWSTDFDLIRGVTGLGVFALERLPRKSATGCLLGILRWLEQQAVRLEEGISWLTTPKWISPNLRARYPRGCFDLGIAHGLPGVIALLSQLTTADIAPQRTNSLLEGAVPWLLARRRKDCPGLSFPSMVSRALQPSWTRSAWCYGDPGVAAALLAAGRCTSNHRWEQQAVTIATEAMNLTPAQAGVVDAGLCHGSAGLGHIYNRLYQTTNEPSLRRVAQSWFKHTLALRQECSSTGGFLSWEVGVDGQSHWCAASGFLTGAAGIGLALLAAVSPISPDWDRVMLLSGVTGAAA